MTLTTRQLNTKQQEAMDKLLLGQWYVDSKEKVQPFLDACSDRFFSQLVHDSTDYLVGGEFYEG